MWSDKYEALGGQEFMDVINSVNKLLTEEAMTSMNAAVDLDKKTPADSGRVTAGAPRQRSKKKKKR